MAEGRSGILFKQEGNKILATLRAQRQQGKYCDITLIVGSKKHAAHRSILAASSPFFENMLRNQRSSRDGLHVDWDDSQSFEQLIDYLYSGEILLGEENIESVVRLADHFQISKLKSHCEDYCKQLMSLENCLKIKQYADTYSLTGTKDVVNQFIADHITDVLPQTALLELSIDKFASFIADPATGCDSISHHTLLTAIAAWVKSDVGERARDFPQLLDVVNWADSDPSEVIKHIESEPLYQDSRECLFCILRALVKSNVEIGQYAEVYEDLCGTYEAENPLHDRAPIVISNEPEHEEEQQNPQTRRGLRSRSSASASPAKAQSARKRPAEREEAEPEETSSGRPSRRRVKPKSFSSDWVTGEDTEPKGGSAAKRPKRTTATAAIVKVESGIEADGSDVKTGAEDEIGVEVNEPVDFDDSEDTANDEPAPDHDDEEAAQKRIAARLKSLGHASKSQWKSGIKCPDCSYVGYSALRLEQHFQKVHEDDQTFQCRMCDFECKWNREYYKHMKGHYDGPPYKCEDCEYTCDRIQFILSHRMKHTDERPFGCELCDFSSRTKGNLIVHMRIHTGEKPYRCQHCGRCFAMKNTLDQHMATHRDDRPFLCDTCGFTTKYKSHLLSHERIHSGNVFYCEQASCQYFSPRRSQLAAHMRSHLSIRSHICSTCGRGFIEKSHLIRHERIHLDDKPFKCDSCDYGSTRRDKLKEHKAKYHNAEGTPAAKANYKPRKKAGAAGSRDRGQGDGMETTHHVVHITNGDEEDVDEQEVATAYLIDEYNGDGTGQATRIVLQGDFGDQTVFVEGQPSGDGEDSNGVIVIHAGGDE